MIKTFTVQGISHKEISPGKGSIIWLLTDENGQSRKVNAITDIAANGVIKKIRAVYKREVPLVERLHNVAEGAEVVVDFSTYNRQENYAPRQVYADMRAKENAGKLAANFSKAAMVVGIFVVLWFFYSAVSDVSQMQLNLSQVVR